MKHLFVAALAALTFTAAHATTQSVKSDATEYNPFEEMCRLQQEMDAVFEKFHQKMMQQKLFSDFSTSFPASPDVDLEDRGDHYLLQADIPGSDKNEINISAKDGVLKIEAKTSKEREEKGDNYLKQERFSGTYARILTLPNDADSDKMSSEYKNGVLSITIPKKKRH